MVDCRIPYRLVQSGLCYSAYTLAAVNLYYRSFSSSGICPGIILSKGNLGINESSRRNIRIISAILFYCTTDYSFFAADIHMLCCIWDAIWSLY